MRLLLFDLQANKNIGEKMVKAIKKCAKVKAPKNVESFIGDE